MEINIKPCKVSTSFKVMEKKVVTSNYDELNNLPLINDVELVGNKTANDLMLQEKMTAITNLELEEILK